MNFDYEKMYAFRYRAKGEGHLSQYDKAPLIFIIDIQKDHILALNVHWIPKQHRQDFISKMEDIIGKTKRIGQRLVRQRLTYKLLKDPKYRNGLEAIRKYIITNMSAIQPVPKVKWEIVLDIRKYRMRIAKKENNYKV